VIDSVEMTISLTQKHLATLIKLVKVLLNLKNPTIRYVAKVIGHIVPPLPASKFGPLHYRKLEIDKINALRESHGNFDAKMSISEAGLQDLRWWSDKPDNMTNWLHPPPISKQIKTDASGFVGVEFLKTNSLVGHGLLRK